MHRVFETFFSPFHFRQSLPDVWAGFIINVKMMVIAEVLVLVLGLCVAIIRGLPGRAAAPPRALAVVYTDVFRGTPLILVAFLVGFGLPGLRMHLVSYLSIVTYGIIALTLVYTAYVSEVYRAGIQSVHPSQRMAARSLGLSYAQAMRYVIPPLLNDFVGLQKDTAIVSVIGITEAAQQAQNYSSSYFNFTAYVVGAVLFIFMT